MLAFVFVLKNTDGAHLRIEPGQYFLYDLFSKSQIYKNSSTDNKLDSFSTIHANCCHLELWIVGGVSPTFWLEIWPERSEFSRALQVYALKSYLCLI